jgi:hypothetical protein
MPKPACLKVMLLKLCQARQFFARFFEAQLFDLNFEGATCLIPTHWLKAQSIYLRDPKKELLGVEGRVECSIVGSLTDQIQQTKHGVG